MLAMSLNFSSPPHISLRLPPTTSSSSSSSPLRLNPSLTKLKVSSCSLSGSNVVPKFPLCNTDFLRFKSSWNPRVLVLPVRCFPGPTEESTDDAEPMPVSSSSLLSENSTYSWCAGVGGLGFIETSYLTYLKLSNSDALCPVGGGTCNDVLNSDYAMVLGVPLPLIGMTAYGLVVLLGLKLGGWNLPFKINQTDGRLILLSVTTSMAAASAYFLYILSTRFAGDSCLYCLASAMLSFSLFFIILKDFVLQEIPKVVVLPLCTASIVLAVLSTTYSSVPPASPSSAVVEFPFYTSEITTESSPSTIALAKHLHSIGAKMYGAFWCSHCLEQKEMFGREAAKLLDYVECFPDGYKKGVVIAPACFDAGIEGFPTWIINGEVLSGEQKLEELARVSGFDTDKFNQPK